VRVVALTKEGEKVISLCTTVMPFFLNISLSRSARTSACHWRICWSCLEDTPRLRIHTGWAATPAPGDCALKCPSTWCARSTTQCELRVEDDVAKLATRTRLSLFEA